MSQQITTKAGLLAEIEPAWNLLSQALDRLSDTRLREVRDAQGWSVTDHAVHLAAWERSAVFFLQGRPRPANGMIR